MRLLASVAPLLLGALLACGNTRLDLLRAATIGSSTLTASASGSNSIFDPGGPTSTSQAPAGSLSIPLTATTEPSAVASDDAGPIGCAAQGVLTEDTYRLVSRVSMGCIQAINEVVRVGTLNFGYALVVTSPCPSDASDEFRLTAMLNGGFQIRFVGSGDPPSGTVFDVKMGSDLPGTAVILYDSNGLANQQFRFNVRANGFAAILPGNSLNLCVALGADGHLLTETCNLLASEQEWQLLPPDCPVTSASASASATVSSTAALPASPTSSAAP